MRIVFADAGFWIAKIDPDDKWALQAQRAADALTGAKLVTTDFLIAETLNAFSGKGAYWRNRAADFALDSILSSGQVYVMRPSGESIVQAIELYGGRGDKEWGLTDCISFSLMRDLGIVEALAHDHHFEQAGFRALLRET